MTGTALVRSAKISSVSSRNRHLQGWVLWIDGARPAASTAACTWSTENVAPRVTMIVSSSCCRYPNLVVNPDRHRLLPVAHHHTRAAGSPWPCRSPTPSPPRHDRVVGTGRGDEGTKRSWTPALSTVRRSFGRVVVRTSCPNGTCGHRHGHGWHLRSVSRSHPRGP